VESTKQLLDKLGGRAGRFSFNQKVLAVAILAAAVVSVVIFATWLRHEDKAVLFTNLSPEDAASALEELAKQNVEADLTNGGSTVLVPQGDVHRLRVDLAAKGIPSAGVVGFEIFDGKQYGLTEFLQDVNFKRALEGELTKSIESLAGINSARVHLVIPKPSIFKKMQTPATASVVVGMARNARLGEQQIQGIQALVSGSVEGLTAANVTVIDQHGTVLSRHFGDQEGVGRSEGQLALKKEVDDYLGSKAESMLAEVLGEERAIVRVDATLNFDRIQKNRELYDPAATVVRSEERNESSGGQAGETTESSVTNYEINKTVESIVGEVGGVKQLSVAVFVDGRYTTPEGGGEPVYSPLSDEERGQLQRIVATAVGLNAERGDQIEVVNMQFRGREPAPEAPAGLLQQPWLHNAPETVGRLLLFVVAAVMVLALKRNLGQLIGGGEARRGGAARAAAPAEAPEAQMPSIRSAAGQHNSADRMIDEVKEYASEKPEEIAELIQTWVTENETV